MKLAASLMVLLVGCADEPEVVVGRSIELTRELRDHGACGAIYPHMVTPATSFVVEPDAVVVPGETLEERRIHAWVSDRFAIKGVSDPNITFAVTEVWLEADLTPAFPRVTTRLWVSEDGSHIDGDAFTQLWDADLQTWCGYSFDVRGRFN